MLSDRAPIEFIPVPVRLRQYLLQVLDREYEREKADLPKDCVYWESRAKAAAVALKGNTVRFPVIYEFDDEVGDRFEVVAWDEHEARRMIRDDGRAVGELTFACMNGIAWPGGGVTRRSATVEWEGGE